MHTIIRDKTVTRDEFIFYSKRLMRQLIEFTLSHFPMKVSAVSFKMFFNSNVTFSSQEVTVQTREDGLKFAGKRMDCSKICGVSILRAGETMEQALQDVVRDVSIGKILIQTNPITNEPEVFE